MNDSQLQTIVDQVRAQHPDWKLFQIVLPGRDEEVYLARKCPWGEYKRLIGKVKDEAEANEVIVQTFLAYPKVDYETMQLEWDPGLVVTLAQQIQRGLGFSQEAAQIKKL